MKRERDELIVLPPNPAPHITDWLMEIGPTVPAGMGEGPIGWEAMDAWSRLTGIELDPWEARTIRRLSEAFISQRHEARAPLCPPPFTDAPPKAVRDKVGDQFKAMVSALAARKHQPRR